MRYKCSLDYAKRSFCRAANAIIGKIGRVASEEVITVVMCAGFVIWSRSLCFEYFWRQISRLRHWQILYEAIQN